MEGTEFAQVASEVHHPIVPSASDDTAVPSRTSNLTTEAISVTDATTTTVTALPAEAQEAKPSTSSHKKSTSTTKKSPPDYIRSRAIIQNSDNVLIQLPSKNIKLVRLTPQTNIINLGKFGTFSAQELIGQPYGVTFEVIPPTVKDEDGNDVEVEEESNSANGNKNKGKKKQTAEEYEAELAKKPLSTLKRLKGVTLEEIEGPGSTNEKILATGAKTLTYEEIQEMKRQGISGKEIIERQIAEHEQFALKNEYSKAKYKSRKESKFLKFFTPLPPTIHNVCQYHFQNDSRRIRELRPDTLAQMLALANVRPGSKVIVVDDAGGLVAGAVAERMGGEGSILLLHPHDSPPAISILPLLNLPSWYTRREVFRPLHWGYTAEDWKSGELPQETETDGQSVSDKERSKRRRKLETRKYLEDTISEFRNGEYDALVVASQYEPLSIVKKILPALGGSAQVVVQSPAIQPLSDLLQTYINSKELLNPTIVEPWMRQYQVLPGRTHPEMNGIAHGGYILHATRILDDGVVATAGSYKPRKKQRR